MPEIGKDGAHPKKGGEAAPATTRRSSKGAGGTGSTKSSENEDKTTKVMEVNQDESQAINSEGSMALVECHN